MPSPSHPARASERLTVVLCTLLSAALVSVAAAAARAHAVEPRVIEIVARRFQFTPGEVTLRKDEPVILRLRSDDVTHGFYMKQLGIDATITPGQVTDVPLTPREAGRFVTICDHFCGAGHGNMKVLITVE
jgi:cytochrome c oxidase subunit II